MITFKKIINFFFLCIPSLLAIFPSLFLFFNNIESIYVPFYAAFLALLSVGAVIFFCVLIINFFIRDTAKTVILACIATLAIFYYGYFFSVVQSLHLGFFSLDRNRKAMLFLAVSVLILGFLALKTKKSLNFLCKIIGIFTIALFAVSFTFFVTNSINKNFSQHKEAFSPNGIKESLSPKYANSFLGYLPDVYYIIPDGYENPGGLKEFLEYDDNDFLSYLKQKGFTVVLNSQNNYPSTLFSVPTTLNMDYGDTLIPDFLTSSVLTRRNLVEESKTSLLFKSLGYQYIAVVSDSTTFSGDEADVRFGPSLLFRLLIRPTIFDPFSQRFRERILNAFDSIDKASALTSPKFVLAHIICPHEPYVFGQNGEQIGINTGKAHSANDMKLYVNQLKFVNKELEKTIDVILKNSVRTPIIIIQSDHGVFLPDSYGQETVRDVRFQNLSAFLFPKKVGNLPSYNINTFRFIFDHYFGTSFGLLENKKIYTNLAE